MGHVPVGVTSMAILIVFGLYILDSGTPCNTELPPVGPRLLRAKALFGEGMRVCKKEIVAYANTIPSQKIRKILQASCSAFNTCKTLAQEDNLEPAYQCLVSQAQSTTSPSALWLNMSDEYRDATQGALIV
ncbi:uncharacterized protein LOC125939813 [Dermacentor silvarum]|uniref:uncharacterized protein LOC125939813 n=1 Tax=Dermacentor silvarum TaxID=543639 RepID=UPI002100EF76|nr:uncharacterized protein LOC125939813 [Dermacentor silvarum]